MSDSINGITSLRKQVAAMHASLGRCFCLSGEYEHALEHFALSGNEELGSNVDALELRKLVTQQLKGMKNIISINQVFASSSVSQEKPFLESNVLRDFLAFTDTNEEKVAISYRSVTCLNGAFFYKGYSLNLNYYQNELRFYENKVSLALKKHLPEFLGFSNSNSCKVLIFKRLDGCGPNIYEWPALLQDIIKLLAKELYSITHKKLKSDDFFDGYQHQVFSSSAEFEALDFTKPLLNEKNIHLAQVHGDLKIPNVLLTDDNWFLVDWEATTVAPIYVDLLKAFLDFTRREKDKQVLLELPALLRLMLWDLNTALGIDSSDQEQVRCDLYAAVWHLVAQEVLWSNKNCLNKNYRLLLPLIKAAFAEIR
ncbi:phosphotransferase [Alkalimonas delamerensis]|uniref:Phosphotransferase n=1 Tax=Alkalimonas delamerensis TaxID=265981 RepID=A0ABT9GQD1_9GAMM|nr:phosphotransferase [Alkalimonas delamerensis]MDP4528985.1 phosphotransferase [Alkalimonas delamerensis]